MNTNLTRRRSYKKDDREPALQVQILNPDGSPRDVTDDIIVFNMGEPGQAQKVSNGAVTKIVQTDGVVEYRWAAGDLDTANKTYRAEFVLNGNDRRPKDGYIIIEVEDVV